MRYMFEGPGWVGAAARVARAACREDMVSVAGGWKAPAMVVGTMAE